MWLTMLGGSCGGRTHKVLGEVNEGQKQFPSSEQVKVFHQLEVARKVRVLHQQAPQQLQGTSHDLVT